MAVATGLGRRTFDYDRIAADLDAESTQKRTDSNQRKAWDANGLCLEVLGKNGRRSIVEILFEENTRNCRLGLHKVGIRAGIVEYCGIDDWRHPGRSIVEKALRAGRPGLMILYGRYRLIGGTSAEAIASS